MQKDVICNGLVLWRINYFRLLMPNPFLYMEQLWHYVGGPLSKRFLCLFWRETKQRPEIEILTRPEVGKGTPVRSWKKELREGSWRWATERAVGSRHWTAKEISQHEIESSSSGRRTVKMSQHSSWFVEISLEIHTSVSQQGMQCHNLTFLHLSWPKPYCSCVLCSFSPTPLIVFLVAIEKCVIPLSEPRDDSPAKIEMV